MGLWILISGEMWAEPLPLTAAGIRKEANKPDFLISISLLCLLSTYCVPSPVLVTGGHCSEQRGTDNVSLEFLCPSEGLVASPCQAPCGHEATGPGVLSSSRRGDVGRVRYMGYRSWEALKAQVFEYP